MDSSHRPWPVPSSPWLMRQVWRHLLFAHWPVDPEEIRPYIPDTVELDTYDGQAWIGFIFLQVRGMRLRLIPSVPLISRYPELNVRTYVTSKDKPGVYFFSLDAASHFAVRSARTFFHLPYHFAKISVKRDDDLFGIDCQRAHSENRFAGWYKPTTAVYRTKTGSLDYWLSERYCLYVDHHGILYRCELLHEPWPLQQATGEITKNTMLDLKGVSLSGEPLLHYVEQQEALSWGLEEVDIK